MREKLEDFKYELKEFQDVLIKHRYEIPEDTYKVLFDLLFHALNTLKELEVIIHDQERAKTRDRS